MPATLIKKWTVLNLLLISMSTSLLNGCALLSSDMTEEEMYENDPVGRAALALRTDRSPAGQKAASDSDIGSSRDFGERADASLQPPPGQLTLGMSTRNVQALWGRPQEVETAGDPTSGNQRWISLNGLNKARSPRDYRVLTFEQNHVWAGVQLHER